MSVAVHAANAASTSANAAAAELENDPENQQGEGSGDPGESTNDGGSVNERLLRESKAHKEKYLKAERERQNLAKRLDEIERQKREQDGKFKEIADEYKGKYETLKKNAAMSSIKAALAEPASKAGCQTSVDHLLKLGNPQLLSYDEDANEVSGADLFIEAIKKEIPSLFKTVVTPPINPARPGGVTQVKTKTAQELMKLPAGHPERQAALRKAFEADRRAKGLQVKK